MPTDPPICSPRSLPADLVIPAARVATALNPANAPSRAAWAPRLEPERLALLTTSYWGNRGVHLTVGFLEPTPAALADRILSHMGAWGTRANVRFAHTDTDPMPMVRITRRGDGYWSYLGTGILSIPKGEPTMSLQGFDMDVPESEYRRVVRHETGHTLGFAHELMRPELVQLLDERKTLAYFRRTQGWTDDMIRAQVLTPLDPATLRATDPDQLSIMTYSIPSECTVDGKPILGGLDIDENDYQFAASLYPLANATPMTSADIAERLRGVL